MSLQGIFQIQVTAQGKKAGWDDKQRLHRIKNQGFSLQHEAF